MCKVHVTFCLLSRRRPVTQNAFGEQRRIRNANSEKRARLQRLTTDPNPDSTRCILAIFRRSILMRRQPKARRQRTSVRRIVLVSYVVIGEGEPRPRKAEVKNPARAAVATRTVCRGSTSCGDVQPMCERNKEIVVVVRHEERQQNEFLLLATIVVVGRLLTNTCHDSVNLREGGESVHETRRRVGVLVKRARVASGRTRLHTHVEDRAGRRGRVL